MQQNKNRTSSRRRSLPWSAVLATLAFALAAPPVDAAEDAAARLLPVGQPPAPTLDVVDLIEASDDEKLAAITLQGLVNRGDTAPVFFLLFDTKGYPTLFWLKLLETRGYIQGTAKLSVEAYFEKYLGHAQGLVVYDPELPATINIATMIASVESRMVVAPADVVRFASALPDVTDLRGRWTTNAEAYTWAFDTLWPMLSHDMLAVYHPTHTKHHLRDYLVSNRVFTFWVTGKDHDQAACADHAAERALAERALAAAPPNTPMIGWWGADPDPGMNEYDGVGLGSAFGKTMLGINWQTNLSLLSGVPVDVDAALARFRAREEAPGLDRAAKDKIYISYVFMESGDAPTYWQHIQKRVWDDEKRGTLPIGWTITPTLFETLPSVGEWFLDHASARDHFVMALSGWGYCHPYRNFMGRTADPEAGWRAFLESTGARMQRMGLPDLGLYTNAWFPFRRAEQDTTTRRFVEGLPALRTLILGMGRDAEITETEAHYLMDDTVVSHIFTRWDPANIGRSAANNQWLADEIRAQTPKTRPAFMFVHPLSWSYYPSDLADVTEQLGDDYVVVSPATLSRFIRASLQ